MITFEFTHATFTNFPAVENPDGTYTGDHKEMDLAIDIAYSFSHRHGAPTKRLVGDWETVKKMWQGVSPCYTPTLGE